MNVQDELYELSEECYRLSRKERVTRHDLRAARLTLEKIEREIETVERRAHQAQSLDSNPDQVVHWLGDIYDFVEDLAYHAKRLGRSIAGDFNGKRLCATPLSSPQEVFDQYVERAG